MVPLDYSREVTRDVTAEQKEELPSLFSLNLTEYEKYLEESTIDPELQEAFEEEGYDIEDDAELSEKNLFSLNRTEYEEYLEEGQIDENLIEAFNEEGYDIADDSNLSEEDGKWFISKDREKEYRIEVGEEELKIYEEGVWYISEDGAEKYRIEVGKETLNIYYEISSYEHYVENWDDVGATNLVVAVLMDWRAYDSMGEAIILFTSIFGFYVLLGGEKDEDVDGG